MTLKTSIQALSPFQYWPLDDAAGTTTIADASGNSRTGALTGTNGLAAYGPESTSSSIRLWSDTIITGPALGQTSFGDFSIMVIASFPSTGSVASLTDFMGFGDPSNRNARGFRLQSRSVAVGQLQYSITFANTSFAPTANTWANNWHMFVFTHTVSGNSNIYYIDTTQTVGTATTLTVAPISSDKFWIQSSQAMQLSHVAYWQRALTITDANSVGSQITFWPGQNPINVPAYPVQGPVTISGTDTQTSTIINNQNTFMPKITDTQTKVTSIQTVTNTTDTNVSHILTVDLPNLAAGIAEVLDGITTTLSNAAGSISKKLGDFFAQHARDEFAFYDPTAGPTCDPIDIDISGAVYFGCTLIVTSWPSDWTFTTPDDAWSIRDLAVLTFEIAGNQVERFGIHTKSFEVKPLPGIDSVGYAGIGMPIAMSNYHIKVAWAGGVCGHIQLQYLPG